MQARKSTGEICVFNFSSYKAYLTQALPTAGSQRGLRARLARTLGCQPAFISQVINGPGQFSLEHAFAISEFLGLGAEESRYFLLLVQLERAGTEPYRRHVRSELKKLLKAREVVKDRIKGASELNEETRAIYYGTWLYAAVHIMTSVPKLQTPEAIAARLHLPITAVKLCLDFLVNVGLVAINSGRYIITSKRIHLGTDSPLLGKHHMNWRLRAMQALEGDNESLLHYSSVISLSESDVGAIKDILLKALEQQEAILRDSKEEAVFCLSMDFFRLYSESSNTM